MALQYSPKIVTDSLVMCLDASNNKSYPAVDLPVKGGLALWLDAADDTAFSYSSGTSVSQWRDKSSNNFHASQGTVASQPSRSTAQNSRKTVNFDGTNDTVTIPNFTCNSEMSIFVVSNCGTSLLIEHSTDANSNQGFYFYGGGNGMIYITRATGSIIFNSNWLSGGYSIASAANSTGLDLLTYKNGTQQTIITDGRSSLTNSYITNTLYIGSRGANSLWSSGPIAEIIIYNRKVTNAERNLIHTYLGQKWGIFNADRSIIDLSGFNDNGLLGNGTEANMPDYDYYEKGTLRFNGSSDFFPVTRTLSVPLTISGFIKYIDPSKTLNTFMNGQPHPTLAISLNRNGSGNLQVFIGNGSAWLGTPSINSLTTISANTWYHIAFTCDGTISTLYLNGVNVGTSANIPSGFGSYFYMGHLTDNASSSEYLKGNIANAQLYTKALSAVEVIQNYEAQKSKFANTIVQQGLVLNLDAGNPYSYAGAGTIWYDVSGNNLIFNSQGTTQTPFTTIGGSPCFDFNGSGYWECGTNFNLVDLGGDCTIIIWFYCETTAIRRTIFEKAGTSYQSYQQEIAVTWETANDFSYYSRFSPSYDYASTAASTVNAWNMVGIKMSTGKTTAARTGFYSKNGSAWSASYNSQSNVALVAAGAIRIGSGYAGTVTDGYIGSVLCYNRMLTDAEILQNYNATKGRFGL